MPETRSGRPAVRVAAVWQVGDAVVLVRRGPGASGGAWDLPGGLVAVGETLAEAVVRVVADDAAVDALCGPFIGWSESVEDGPHTLTMYFEVVVLDPPGIDQPTGAMAAGSGCDEVRCTPVWEVTEIPLRAGLAEFLADHDLIELVI